MIASGFRITAQLPYLRQLIRGLNESTIRTRRIHLVWQLAHIGKGKCYLREPFLYAVSS